jgi:Ser/Thr protein kinase RdoA (MazF antagonist)
VRPLADLVRVQIGASDGRLELDLFGTEAPGEVAAALEDFLAGALGESAGGNFYVSGVGAVAGLHLADGRDVVVKVHRWNAEADRLAATQVVQAHLADRGLPMPRPLVGPTPLGRGLATVEEHLAGDRIDGRTPEARQAMAAGLQRLVDAAREVDADVGRALVLRPPDAPLWPEPHSLRFDFEATADGAEWIDEHGEAARRRLDAVDLPDVIGHLDWRVQNLAFTHGEISAVYDNDSIGKGPEPVVVGCAAGGFCIDWDADVEDPPPTPDEMRAFVADYEAARGEPFDEEEREALDAANLAMIAYSARSQHSDLYLQPEIGDTRAIGWFRLLRDRGERCF